MPLFTKCLKCGGWRQMPDDPSAQSHFPTGLMMNVDQPPGNLCRCDDDAAGDDAA